MNRYDTLIPSRNNIVIMFNRNFSTYFAAKFDRDHLEKVTFSIHFRNHLELIVLISD